MKVRKICPVQVTFRAHLDEFVFQPVVIFDSFRHWDVLPVYIGYSVANIWKLGGGVVAPDNTVPHLVMGHSQPGSNLRKQEHKGVCHNILFYKELVST